MQIFLALSQPLKKAASAAALLTPTSLLYILALCVLTAALAWFLQTASGPGMILRPWRKLIFGLWWKGRPRRWVTATPEQRPTFRGPLSQESSFMYDYARKDFYKAWRDTFVRQYTPAKWWRMLYKPLGGCVYCNGPWLLMPYFFGLTLGLLGWPFWLAAAVLPLAIGGQYAVIELLNDYAK